MKKRDADQQQTRKNTSSLTYLSLLRPEQPLHPPRTINSLCNYKINVCLSRRQAILCPRECHSTERTFPSKFLKSSLDAKLTKTMPTGQSDNFFWLLANSTSDTVLFSTDGAFMFIFFQVSDIDWIQKLTLCLLTKGLKSDFVRINDIPNDCTQDLNENDFIPTMLLKVLFRLTPGLRTSS